MKHHLHGCVRLVMSVAIAAVAVSSSASVASAAVHPLDAVLPDDTPMPGKGLVAWIPGGSTSYVLAGGKLVKWKAKTVDFNGTPGIDVSADGSSAGAQVNVLSPKSPGMTVVVDYRMPKGTAKVDGWNPTIGVLAHHSGTYHARIWTVALKAGVPRLAVSEGTTLKSATAVKSSTGKKEAVRLDDGEIHQLALRVSRPGCTPTKCPAPHRNIVTLLVDGVVVSEGIVVTPRLKTKGFSTVEIGRQWVGAGKYPGQSNYKDKNLNSVGQYRQLLVYDRPLPTGELAAIRRSAAIGVVAQFPPLGNETTTQVKFNPSLQPTDLRLAPMNATISKDVFAHKRVKLLPDTADQNKGLTAVSGWIKFGKSAATKKLLTVTFPGTGAPVEFTIGPDPKSAKKALLTCKHAGKTNQQSLYWDAAKQWAHVAIVQRGNFTKDVVCSVNGQFLGGLKVAALKVPTYNAATIRDTAVQVGPGVDVLYLGLRRRNGFQHFNEETEFNGRDPLAQGPMLWMTQSAGKFSYHRATTGSYVVGTGMSFITDGHALGNIRLFGSGLWTYSDKDSALYVDRQTVAIRLTLPQPDAAKSKSYIMYQRVDTGANMSISVSATVPDKTNCIKGFFNNGGCATVSISFGPRKFDMVVPSSFLGATPGELIFTTPYKRSPEELKAWGNPKNSWQPDIIFRGKRRTPLSWSEGKSKMAAKFDKYGGDTKAQKDAWKKGHNTILYATTYVQELRLYPQVVGELGGLMDIGCYSLKCTDAGRACKYATKPYSPRCGDCRPDHYRTAGYAGSIHQECRARRPRGAACTHDTMCQSGRCDTAKSGTCVFKVKASCDNHCRSLGRTCGVQGTGFDCSGCLPWFEPANGAPIPKSGAPKPKLLPDEQCRWQPTRTDLEPCTHDNQCDSGRCSTQNVDRVRILKPTGWIFGEFLYTGSGFNNCEKSPVQCSAWTARRGVSGSMKTIGDTKKRCRIRLPNIPSPDTDPCVEINGRTHDPGSVQNVKRPDGSVVKTATCRYGGGGSCARPGEELREGVLSSAACERAIRRSVKNTSVNRRCFAEKRKACDFCLHKVCKKDHDKLNQNMTADEKKKWGVKHPKPVASSVYHSITKTSGFTATDLVRAFYPFSNDMHAQDASLTYNVAAHRNTLLKNGVSQLMLDYALANSSTKYKMEQEHGQFLPLIRCSRQSPSALNTAYTKPYSDWPSVWVSSYYSSVYESEYNRHKCRPRRQENGAKCPFPGNTSSGDPGRFCLSNYCSRETKTCQEVDHPMYELGSNGKPAHKSGKSAVKFGVVRLDDTSVNVEDANKANGSLAGKTNNYQFDATMSQNYVSCVLGKPMPSTPLLSTKVFVDRTAGGDACSESETTVQILGFRLDALVPKTESGGLSSCKGINVETKKNLIAGKSQKVGFDMCVDDDSNQCNFTPENLLSLPLSRFFPKPEVCVPTDELELPEVKKDFKEALVPLIVSIGLELDLCLAGSFGLDYETKMPQIQVGPELAIGVVARGGVGSGETGAYEVSAGVRLLLTLVSIGFPVTWGIEADAALKSVTGDTIKGYFKIGLVQRIAMELEFLGGEFGLYAKIAVGPFGLEWTFNVFEWTGIKLAVTLSQDVLVSKIIDFEVPAKNPPAKAAPSCKGGSNPCYK